MKSDVATGRPWGSGGCRIAAPRFRLWAGLLLALSPLSSALALQNPWADAVTPLGGEPKVIGGYTAGCLKGAVSLLPEEGDFHLMRKSRRRYFAHPLMRDFIDDLAVHVKTKGYGKLLVGDQAQARGGPSTTGHASHQIGLDGDFWFWLDSPATRRPLTRRDEEDLSAISMLNKARNGVDPSRFRPKHVALLEYAAGRPGVERIFVHPYIKQALCKQTGQAAWLNRVRPWWGHHYHFHVRLGCPEGQAACKAQKPPPKSPGCGKELDWWFKAMARAAKHPKKGPGPSLEQRLAKKLAKVPPACKTLLN